jgi:hypothetical protein
MAGGGVVSGLVLGVAFTRARGGPVLNLLGVLVWPWVGAGTVLLIGDIPQERIFDFGFDMALLMPGLLVYIGCIGAWVERLGVERVNEWTRRTHSSAFFPDDSE